MASLLQDNPTWLLIAVPGIVLAGLGFLVVFGLRGRAQAGHKNQDLLYRDPALWVRSLPVSPFPARSSSSETSGNGHTNGNGNGKAKSSRSAPKPSVKMRPAVDSPEQPAAASSSRYGREQRCALRRRGNPTTVQIADGNVKELAGWVMDRSTTGLCVACTEDLEVGTTISIRSTHYGDSGPWVLAQVKRCEPLDDGWMIGCRFNESLPWNVLLRFG